VSNSPGKCSTIGEEIFPNILGGADKTLPKRGGDQFTEKWEITCRKKRPVPNPKEKRPPSTTAKKGKVMYVPKSKTPRPGAFRWGL